MDWSRSEPRSSAAGDLTAMPFCTSEMRREHSNVGRCSLAEAGRQHRPTPLLTFFLILVALLADSGCKGRDLDPDTARAELNRRGIEYSDSSFLASVKTGNVDVVQVFLVSGMDPDTRDASSQTALMLAATADGADVLQVLLKGGASVRLIDDDERTALHFAARVPSGTSSVRLLLDYGADPNAKTRRGITPIFEAIYLVPADPEVESRFLSKYIETIAVLLDRGADVNVQNVDGFSPLMRAAASGNAQVVRQLIERGANVSASDSRGWTPLRYALENDNTEAALVIRQAGG